MAADRKPDGGGAAYVWDGGGADNHFSTAANWSPDVVPPNDGTADLVFGGTIRLGPVADTAYAVGSLRFSAGAGAFVLSGEMLTLGSGGIRQDSASDISINSPVRVPVSQDWSFGAGAGTLALGHDLSVGSPGGATLSLTRGTLKLTDNNRAFALAADDGQTGSLNLSGSASIFANVAYVGLSGVGAVNQSGGSFSTSSSSLILGLYSGSSGTYRLGGVGSALFTTATFVGANGVGQFFQSAGLHATDRVILAANLLGTPGTAAYHLDGGTLRTGKVAAGLAAIAGASVFHFNGGTLEATEDRATFLEGLTTADVRDGGARIDTRSFNVTVAQPLVHSTVAGDNATDGGLVKTGTGTLTLTAANSYTGGTQLLAGALAISHPDSLGTVGNITTANGTALDVNLLDNALYVLGSGRTLDCSGIFGGSLTVANGATVTAAGLVGGFLTVNAGGLVALESSVMGVGADVINNGTMRFRRGAAFYTKGEFINNGTLDLITGGYFSVSFGLTNHGVVLDRSVVKTKGVSRSGGTITVTIDSYTGHTYRLQRSDSLGGGNFANLGDAQPGSTGTVLTFTDPAPASGQGFYRVVVDP